MNDPYELRALLGHHTGGDQPYVHSLVRSFFYTEGVRAFAQNAGTGGGYWLLDILATQPEVRKAIEEDGFVLAVLDVTGDTATLTVALDTTADGEGYKGIVYSRHISYTDCPEGRWKFYLEATVVGEQFGVMCMLPAER